MVQDRVTDGRRIAELLASEVRGRSDGPHADVAVVDARDVEPTPGGAFAYAIEASGDRLADVYIHPERVGLAVRDCEGTAATAADAGLPVRTGDDRDGTLVWIESGAAVKSARDVIERLAPGG